MPRRTESRFVPNGTKEVRFIEVTSDKFADKIYEQVVGDMRLLNEKKNAKQEVKK